MQSAYHPNENYEGAPKAKELWVQSARQEGLTVGKSHIV